MSKLILVPEGIESKIYFVRGFKVLLDEDLAKMYQVPTKRLNEQMKRNIKRFPKDFMFQLTIEELENLRSQFATSSFGGRRYLPYAFTEQGVAMLSSVLNSEKAIFVNIEIMRAFVRLRKMILQNKELAKKIEELEGKYEKHDKDIQSIFNAIHKILTIEQKPKRKVGFRLD